MSGRTWQLDRDFARFEHSISVVTPSGPFVIGHQVFHAGSGPALLLMHELPGLAQPCVDFAGRLIEQGFQVFMPHLIGPLMNEATLANTLRLCISREFARLKTGVSAPITDWLRDLARHIADRHGHERIGAIGMCLTGAFVIPLLIERSVQAAVASQPSVPFPSLLTLVFGKRFADPQSEGRINIADADLRAADGCSREAGKALVVQRFTADRLCPSARVAALSSAFAGQVETLEYETSPLRSQSWPPPHALLTSEFNRVNPAGLPAPDTDPTQQVLAHLTAFFHRHLDVPLAPQEACQRDDHR